MMLSKIYDKVVVLEFPETGNFERIKQHYNVTFIRLHGNVHASNSLSKNLRTKLTFDPLGAFLFQLRAIVGLCRFAKVIYSSDIVMIEGSLIPSGNVISKMLRKKVILDTHCVNKLLAKGFKGRNNVVYYLRLILWDVLERFVTRLSDEIIVVSENEKDFIHREYGIPSRIVHIIHHSSPLEIRAYSESEKLELREQLQLVSRVVITFVGDMRAVQNHDAVDYIVCHLAPRICKKRQDVTFLIIGNGNERFENLMIPGNVIFTGYVSDLGKYLSISDICIAPMRIGAGVKTKVLDYLKCRRQVLTTPIGAEGLESEIYQLQICGIEEFDDVLLDILDKMVSTA